MVATIHCQAPFECGTIVPVCVDDSLVHNATERERRAFLDRIAAGFGFMMLGVHRYCARCFRKSESRAAFGNGRSYEEAKERAAELRRIVVAPSMKDCL